MTPAPGWGKVVTQLAAGEAYLSDTPVLAAHAGTQPDLFLRWNEVPETASAVDVAVFLHGFSQAGAAMPLSEKVARSGLDLRGRSRPTLALLPRGNWIRHYYYDFPALIDGGLDVLVAYGLFRLGLMRGSPPPALDRLILAAHSGGGMPAVDIVAGVQAQPDELYLFDALYGRDPATGDPLRGLDTLDRWLAARLAAEPARPGALRVAFIERETGPFSRALAARLAAHLAAAPAELRPDFARRYRVEPARVQHSQIARRAFPDLLADPGADIDWYLPPPL